MQMHKWKAHFATHLEVSYMLMQMRRCWRKGQLSLILVWPSSCWGWTCRLRNFKMSKDIFTTKTKMPLTSCIHSSLTYICPSVMGIIQRYIVNIGQKFTTSLSSFLNLLLTCTTHFSIIGPRDDIHLIQIFLRGQPNVMLGKGNTTVNWKDK